MSNDYRLFSIICKTAKKRSQGHRITENVFARSAQDSLSRHALEILAKGILLETKKTQEEAAEEKTTGKA
ncbi:uncharacterized protein B0T23DRAFT_428886 [Neurospora hispaniola]|uniref:Uncharacterized protein n=1 Tax=Neurospora hispaniola TaxID=588809 RepID=A0AAJ0MRM6_9PEZI|nr:hypothetical protein B0T23DRAFT_428886 [Neurospora hispaniola]